MTLDLKFTSDLVISVGQWLKKIVNDKNLAIMSEGDDSYVDFREGRSLFCSHLLGSFRAFRNTEDDYGLISWPTVEENVEGRIYVRNPMCVFFAKNTADTKLVADIANALAAYGYDYILEDYINKAVVGRGARDAESAEFIREATDRRAYGMLSAMNGISLESAFEKAAFSDSYASVEAIANSNGKNAFMKVFVAYFD